MSNRALTKILLLSAVMGGSSFCADNAPRPEHKWSRIWYPNLQVSRDFKTLVLLEPDKGKQLRLIFSFNFPSKDEVLIGAKVPKTARVRMHLIDGKIIDGKFDGESRFSSSAHGTSEMELAFAFPWQRNVMEEAWLEVELAGKKFWLEVPYGFTREPDAAMTPVDERSGPPKYAPAMKSLGDNDAIMTWTSVEYDALGRLGDDTRVSARFTNKGNVEMIMYSEQLKKWDLHRPISTLFVRAGEVQHGGEQVLVRLLPGRFSRLDGFVFNLAGVEREWGVFQFECDGRKLSFTAPSCLFTSFHGVAEPRNSALIRENPSW